MVYTKYFEWSFKNSDVAPEPLVEVTFNERGEVIKVTSLTRGKSLDPEYFYSNFWKEVKKNNIERI